MIADTPIAALVAAHRSGFTAGLDHPEPAEACTELGAEAEFSEDGPMQMLVVVFVWCVVVVAAGLAVFA